MTRSTFTESRQNALTSDRLSINLEFLLSSQASRQLTVVGNCSTRSRSIPATVNLGSISFTMLWPLNIHTPNTTIRTPEELEGKDLDIDKSKAP